MIVLRTVTFAVVLRRAAHRGVRGRGRRPQRPARDANERRIRQLQVPPAFPIDVFAQNLGNPRMVVADDQDTVYVSRPATDDVVALTLHGGRTDRPPGPILTGLEKAHGLALVRVRLYVAGVTKVVAADLGSSAPEWRTVVDGLPDRGQHGRRTIGVGPDGLLYISVGTSYNTCDETNPEHAMLLRAPLDGGARAVSARGLRNTIGFAWHPDTRELRGMDHGSDWPGDNQPPEELNRPVDGGDYGCPSASVIASRTRCSTARR
jgi:glucose/arabinose dehydrogenase